MSWVLRDDMYKVLAGSVGRERGVFVLACVRIVDRAVNSDAFSFSPKSWYSSEIVCPQIVLVRTKSVRVVLLFITDELGNGCGMVWFVWFVSLGQGVGGWVFYVLC